MTRPPVPDDLRTHIAKVIWKVFQNTPPINATDDEWESWWNGSTQEEKALSYIQADAVIRELNLRQEQLGEDIGHPHPQRRYVTDWTANE